MRSPTRSSATRCLSRTTRWLVFGLAVAAGISAYVSRLFLMRTAYSIEFDLRNMLYVHLTRMEFGFYDRVQTGQLISRANSDIRSVQMYLTFGPAILVQCAIAVVAFIYMLAINVPLALVAMSTIPFVFVLSVRMRRVMFPVSWLIQSRLAEVATIVDENINGVRVVKSFVAEPRELKTLAEAADRLKWSYIKDADLRARFTPAVQNLPQIGLALILLVGGLLVIHGQLGVGAILAFSAYLVMLQAPFQLLGMLVMLGQRASASAKRIYEVLDEQPTILDSPEALDLVDAAKATSSSTRSTSPTPTVRPCSMTSASTSGLGRQSRWSGARRAARRRCRACCRASTTSTRGAVRIDGHDVRELSIAVPAVQDRRRARRAVPVLDLDPRQHRLRPSRCLARGGSRGRPVGRRRGVHPRSCRTATTRSSASAATRCPAASASAWRSPARCWSTRRSSSSTTPPARSTSRSNRQIHEGLRVLMEGRTTLIVAHRLSTIGLADRVVLVDGGKIVADGTHNELMRELAAVRRGARPGQDADRRPAGER